MSPAAVVPVDFCGDAAVEVAAAAAAAAAAFVTVENVCPRRNLSEFPQAKSSPFSVTPRLWVLRLAIRTRGSEGHCIPELDRGTRVGNQLDVQDGPSPSLPWSPLPKV